MNSTNWSAGLLSAIIACAFLLQVVVPAAEHGSSGKDYYVYIGTYTGPKSKGIYLYRLETGKPALVQVGVAAETPSPSFLAIHPNHKFLYAVNEVDNFKGQKSGAVSAFAIDRSTGLLTAINEQSSGGPGPCHVSVDHAGKVVLVANYAGGSVAAYPIEKNGGLGAAGTFIQHRGSGVNSQRQSTPHGHFITMDKPNRHALACDLGLDEILVYHLDAKKALLTPNDPPYGTVEPGAGPRHLAFHPNGRFVYVINELASTLTTFTYDSKQGRLEKIETVPTLPKGFSGNNSTAEVQMHPSGKFIYGSNRGHNSIAVFSIDQKSGRVQLVQHESTRGKTPRGFDVDPSGRFLVAANQDSNSLSLFAIDQASGRLSPIGEPIPAPMPVCVVFMPVK